MQPELELFRGMSQHLCTEMPISIVLTIEDKVREPELLLRPLSLWRGILLCYNHHLFFPLKSTFVLPPLYAYHRTSTKDIWLILPVWDFVRGLERIAEPALQRNLPFPHHLVKWADKWDLMYRTGARLQPWVAILGSCLQVSQGSVSSAALPKLFCPGTHVSGMTTCQDYPPKVKVWCH